MNKKRLPFVWLILCTLFLITRLVNFKTLPLFSDEAYVIVRAQEVWRTGDWLGMVKFTTQPILIWLVAFFTKLPVETITAGRLVSVISGLTSALLISQAAEKFIHPRTKWLAFCLITLLPFSFFYDRTLLFESNLLAWITAALFLTPLAVPFAILTKQTGWLALPIALALQIKQTRLILLSLIFALAIPLVVWILALGNWEQIVKINFIQTGAPISQSANFKLNLLRAKIWLMSYITLPVFFLTLIGTVKELVNLLKKRTASPIFIIAIWSFLILIFEAKVATIFYPRYLYPVIIGAVLLATSALFTLIKLINKMNNRLMRFAVLSMILMFLVYPSVKFDITLIKSPVDAPLAPEDHVQFFEDWTSGVGSEQINQSVHEFIKNNDKKLIVYVEEENSYYVTLNQECKAQCEVRIGDWLKDPLTTIPVDVMQSNVETWFVRNRHPDIPKDWSVSLILQVQKSPSRNVYLFRINK